MRIHTDKIGYTQEIRNALKSEIDKGRIAPDAHFKRVNPHRSSIRNYAFEIQLTVETKRDGDGRRAGNTGSYGSMDARYDGYAATFDEWGWLLAELFRIDPDLVVGTPKSPVYDGAENFHDITGLTYAPERLIESLKANGGEDQYPYVFGKTGAGRQGAGRSDGDYVWGRIVHHGYQADFRAAEERYARGEKQGNARVKFLPRTIEQVREFGKLEAL